eukprot:3539866-Rhodomonas_salina.2
MIFVQRDTQVDSFVFFSLTPVFFLPLQAGTAAASGYCRCKRVLPLQAGTAGACSVNAWKGFLDEISSPLVETRSDQLRFKARIHS